jgi:hypothetical protein
MSELAGVEVQSIGCSVVPELFAIDESARVAAVQLTVRFVFVLDLAPQFVEGADQFAGRVVFVTAMDRVWAWSTSRLLSPGLRICESFSDGIVDANCQLLRPMAS